MLQPVKFFILLLLCSCSSISQNELQPIHVKSSEYISKKQELSPNEWLNWQHKDPIQDTIAGISLDKAYKELLNTKNIQDTLIVAVLDMRIHKNHEDIKDFIWKNPNEIANNGIDDDQNGYIDDMHGWNFLGNSEGEQAYRANFEYIRVLRNFSPLFKDKKKDDIIDKDIIKYHTYLRAKNEYLQELKYVNKRLATYYNIEKQKDTLEKKIAQKFSKEALSIKQLKSIITEDTIVSKQIANLIKFKTDSIKIQSSIALEKRYLDIYLNKDFNERKIIGDNVDDITDVNYGNNIITSDNSEGTHTHAIKVSGVIAANRTNNKGIRGITNSIKIMPVAISPYGDEQDKDMALAIRYAVNNGAKVINISSSKTFSRHKIWVLEALKYANQKNVLVVTSAGNDAKDLDINFNYPNDTNNDNNEVIDNFIKVGASSNLLDENLIYSGSNYGKREVDIFAPGRFIYTTTENNTYNFISGTSLAAPMVSGLAALIFSYYPNLTASEVKQIIMESGVSYDIMVNKPSRSKEKELVPFSSLSKSGKIVNAYNALLLAEKVSKEKKKPN